MVHLQFLLQFAAYYIYMHYEVIDKLAWKLITRTLSNSLFTNDFNRYSNFRLQPYDVYIDFCAFIYVYFWYIQWIHYLFEL